MGKTIPKAKSDNRYRNNRKERHLYDERQSNDVSGRNEKLGHKKISVVRFKDAQVLVAQAGSAELADKAIEIMHRKASGVMLESEEVAAKIAEDSVRDVRNHLVELNKGCGFSKDEWDRFFIEDHFFELLMGQYCGGKPFLHTVNLYSCTSVKVKTRYRAIGGGRHMAEYLLKGYAEADPDLEFAWPIAVSVAEKTIDNVDGCGRPVWAGLVCKLPELFALHQQHREAGSPVRQTIAYIMANDEITSMAKALSAVEARETKKRKDQLLEVIKSVDNPTLDELLRFADESIQNG